MIPNMLKKLLTVLWLYFSAKKSEVKIMTTWRKGITIKNIFIAFLLAKESTFFPKINSVNGGHFLFLSL